MSKPLIAKTEELSKTYQMGAVSVQALRGLSLEFYEGEYIAVMGPSGCGKSTLLNLLGCLDRATSGRYFLGGDDISELDDDALSAIRGTRIGFVFQSYNLIQQLSVLENIEVPLYYQGCPEHESRKIAEELGELVGLSDRLRHKPFELSGGQQQRVAIARALANDPLILLCDEPTGNLDSVSGAEILNLFDDLDRQGKTIISVTHDLEIAERAKRTIRLRDGRIEDDLYN
ncbi:MAG TPA: ABC transporter ATP-binding protein [Candidatus Hydrogenedentes bacterium]|nr:ABC transporter ATP-binding protein [Candidatus Hydrogenedentota bacterium]